MAENVRQKQCSVVHCRHSSGIKPSILVARFPKNRNCEPRILRNRVTSSCIPISARGSGQIGIAKGHKSDCQERRIQCLLLSPLHLKTVIPRRLPRRDSPPPPARVGKPQRRPWCGAAGVCGLIIFWPRFLNNSILSTLRIGCPRDLSWGVPRKPLL